jgi:hypothetical protein
MSPTTITMFEADRSTPTAETLARIQKVFEEEGLTFVNDIRPRR